MRKRSEFIHGGGWLSHPKGDWKHRGTFRSVAMASCMGCLVAYAIGWLPAPMLVIPLLASLLVASRKSNPDYDIRNLY